ncbi:MAG: transketolase, partial [Calditrichae bacterium]|nr:transketolase [Calditrichia bacterium]
TTLTAEDIINDYRLGYQSRHASILGRREVMSGKAKFGIFGDGKEVAQLAMAKAFQKGDFRSGYYRDQTMMFAIGEHSIYEFFAQLYAHPDEKFDPATAGRAMNAHFATRSLNPDGSWKNLTDMKNSAADLSPTASQMPRLVGLAYASRLYRELEELKQFTNFSNNGNEIAFGTIGNASCAEGMFWETINAIGLMKAPMLLSIWDDEYGISVPNKYQLTKGNISELLKGFQYDPDTEQGFALYTVKGWDYSTLIETYLTAAQTTRKEHIPAIIHIVEMTQPQGHSTSGSHERYKSEERLDWERETDCLKKMREWMVAEGIATDEEMDAMEEQDRKTVENIRNESWEAFQQPIREYRKNLVNFIDTISPKSEHATELQDIKKKLTGLPAVTRKSVMAALRNVLITIRNEDSQEKQNLIQWKNKLVKENNERFSSHLYSLSS